VASVDPEWLQSEHVGLPSFVMLLEIIGVGGQTASKYTHGIAELLALCLSHAGNCLQGV
jgi:hypothetical protein